MLALVVLSIFGAACQNTSSVENATEAPTTEEETGQVAEETIEDSFGDAVNAAMEAAEVTQTAKSVEDWENVASLWNQAIELMKSVPESSENYPTAQQKAEEYGVNLEYAKQNAANIKQAVLAKGEQVFQKLNGVFQVQGTMTDLVTVRTIVSKDDWTQLSKEDQISLAFYTQSRISEVKASPEKYADIPSTAPAYPQIVENIKKICDDCWVIIVGERTGQGNFTVDETILQGDTPWNESNPCCLGISASEFGL
jgi:hypothetical protein